MRRPEYMSPSSLATFYKDPQEYFLWYLADVRPPKFPQTKPMSVGSAFDAYAKHYLHEALFGKDNDPKYSFDALFTSQVEEHNRDWARVHGKYCFEQYKKYGALADLLSELQNSVGKPRFEIEIRGIVDGEREGLKGTFQGVPLLGKPDIQFISKTGAHVIFDFKVSGYCGTGNTSPMRGYLRLRGENTHTMHKDCFPMVMNGMQINAGLYLNDTDKKDWAKQLAIYGWLFGEEIGSEFVTAIDQLACAYNGDYPLIRVAEHRLRISGKFQVEWFKKIQYAWEVINSDHFFRDLTKEDSQKRCELLNNYGETLKDEKNKWLQELVRGQRRKY